MKYSVVVCGGTFDLLHAGHKAFLKQVFEKGERVVIGLTSDSYISVHKSNKHVSPYDVRKKALEQFIKENRVEERVEIVEIYDMYGPLLDADFIADAIAVTEHSLPNAKKINKKREERGLQALEIVEIPLVKDQEGEVISSSRLRQNLLLPSTLRPLLQDTWGKIIQEIPSDIQVEKTITVGDVTTGKFIEKGIFPKICIIDNKVERKDKKFEYEFLPEHTKINVENPAGKLTVGLVEAIENAFKKVRTVIEVDGEEDLAVLPALLYTPIGFEIYYGQPGVGLVRIKVNGDVKRKAAELVDKFEYD